MAQVSSLRCVAWLAFYLATVNLGVAALPAVLVNETWDGLSAWTNPGTGLVEINPTSQLHLVSNSTTLAQVYRYLPVPSTYTFETNFKVDTFGNQVCFAVYDGLYRLQVYFTPTGLKVRNSTGALVTMLPWTSDTNWHDYRFEVDNGVAEVYVDNVDKGSVALNASVTSKEIQYFVQGTGTVQAECHVDTTTLLGPPPVPIGVIINADWSSLTNWSLLGAGTKELNPAGELHLLSSGSATTEADDSAAIPQTYSLETQIKIDSYGTANGLAVYDGTNRLHVYFTSAGIKIRNAANSLVLMHTWISDTNWHTYRFDVSNGSVHLTMDDTVDLGTTTLNPNTSAAKLEYWVAGPTTGEMHVGPSVLYMGSYSYNESFSSYADGSIPDYWMESGAGDMWSYAESNWKVTNLGGNYVYHANCLTNADARTQLHVFAKDVVFESKVQVNNYNATTGTLCWIVRGNQSDGSRIMAQYTFSDQTWRLIEQDSVLASAVTRATSAPVSLGVGWNTVHVEANEGTVSLTVNGMPVISASNFIHVNWGRVGLQARYVDAYFDDVVYSGEGRVDKGVKEMTFQQVTSDSDMVQLANGKIIMDQGGIAGYVSESSDGGLTWQQRTKSASLYQWTSSNNMLVLQNGDLLSVQNYWAGVGYGYADANKYQMINYSFISHDNGVSWEGPYPVQTETKYRITMPNKLSQAPNGRIFFASGEQTNPPGYSAGVWIYYSDDGGHSWTKSQTQCDSTTFGINLQEGKVVGISGNTLKAFFRTDRLFLYELTSTDNGVTWGNPKATSLVSPMCSFNVERDASTGYYFMEWEYNETGTYAASTWPRTRVSLAVSTDNTATWKFLMDLDDQPAIYDNFHENHSMRVANGYVWCEIPTCYQDAANNRYIRLYRVNISNLNPYVEFPPVH